MASTPATPATAVLTRASIAHTVHGYDTDRRSELARPDGAGPAGGYGVQAAAALGVGTDRLFKTLIATVDGRAACAVVPVGQRLNLKALAAALGGKKAALAEPAAAERLTGYVVGGISPLGQRTQLPVIIDESARRHETVLVSAGRRGLQVELAPEDLLTATRGTWAPVATSTDQ